MDDTKTPSSSWSNQWLAPLWGVLWFGLFEAYFRWPTVGIYFLVVALILNPLILRGLRRRWPHGWPAITSSEIIVLTSAAAMTFLTSPIGRQLVAMSSAGLMMLTLQAPTTSPLSSLRGRLTLFVMTVSYWFGWLTLLSLSIFLSWPVWALALASAALTVAVATVVWLDGGVPFQVVRRGSLMAAWLGLELFLVIWTLPTSIFVGSVIATTTIMLWLQLCRHLWLKTWQPDRGRRYLLVGGTVITMVLLTARWI